MIDAKRFRHLPYPFTKSTYGLSAKARRKRRRDLNKFLTASSLISTAHIKPRSLKDMVFISKEFKKKYPTLPVSKHLNYRALEISTVALSLTEPQFAELSLSAEHTTQAFNNLVDKLFYGEMKIKV